MISWWVRAYLVGFVGLIGCMVTSFVGMGTPPELLSAQLTAVARGLAPLVTFVTGVAMAVPVYHKTIQGPGWIFFLGFFLILGGWYWALKGPALLIALALGLAQGFGTGIVLTRPEGPLPKRVES